MAASYCILHQYWLCIGFEYLLGTSKMHIQYLKVPYFPKLKGALDMSKLYLRYFPNAFDSEKSIFFFYVNVSLLVKNGSIQSL